MGGLDHTGRLEAVGGRGEQGKANMATEVGTLEGQTL